MKDLADYLAICIICLIALFGATFLVNSLYDFFDIPNTTEVIEEFTEDSTTITILYPVTVINKSDYILFYRLPKEQADLLVPGDRILAIIDSTEIIVEVKNTPKNPTKP